MLQEKQEDNVKKQSSLAEKHHLRDCAVFRHLQHAYGVFGVNCFYDIHFGNEITIEVSLRNGKSNIYKSDSYEQNIVTDFMRFFEFNIFISIK